MFYYRGLHEWKTDRGYLLDTCLTARDPVWNEAGTLFEGIECWAKRKEKLTKADVRERVNRAVRLYAASGVQYIRTHVDVTDPKLTAMEALLELRDELKDVVTLQIVAFRRRASRAIRTAAG